MIQEMLEKMTRQRLQNFSIVMIRRTVLNWVTVEEFPKFLIWKICQI